MGRDIPRAQSVVRPALSREQETRGEDGGAEEERIEGNGIKPSLPEAARVKMDSSPGSPRERTPVGAPRPLLPLSSCFVRVRLAGFEGCWRRSVIGNAPEREIRGTRSLAKIKAARRAGRK